MRDMHASIQTSSLQQHCKEGLQNTTNTMNMRDACEQSDAFFVTIFIPQGRINISECVFEALFKGVSAIFELQNVEK